MRHVHKFDWYAGDWQSRTTSQDSPPRDALFVFLAGFVASCSTAAAPLVHRESARFANSHVYCACFILALARLVKAVDFIY